MYQTISGRTYFLKIFSVCIIASFLMWILYQLLMHIKLGLPAECIFMAQICVVLLIAPYLAAYTVDTSILRTRFQRQYCTFYEWVAHTQSYIFWTMFVAAASDESDTRARLGAFVNRRRFISYECPLYEGVTDVDDVGGFIVCLREQSVCGDHRFSRTHFSAQNWRHSYGVF